MRQFKAALGEERITSTSLADVDPFRFCQFGHGVRRNFDGCIGRAGGRNHFVVASQRDIAKHWNGFRQTERADATNGMACDRHNIFRAKHSGLCAKPVSKLAIVEPFGTGSHDEKMVSPAFRQMVLAI